jgi:hypothetical protein
VQEIFCSLFLFSASTKSASVTSQDLSCSYSSFHEHLTYEFSLQLSVLTCICTYFSLNKLHFCYNEQLMFISFLQRWGNTEHLERWGEAAIPTNVHLPSSQSVCMPHCDDTESVMLLMLTFHTYICVTGAHHGSQMSENGGNKCW